MHSHLSKCQEIDEYSETPYVDGKVVSPFEGHLWGKVLLCTAEGGFYPARTSGLDELCATEIGDDEMTGDIYENVLWFQVPMNDSGLMERIDGKDQFAGIKESCVGAKCAISHQISEKVPSGTEILIVLWVHGYRESRGTYGDEVKVPFVSETGI